MRSFRDLNQKLGQLLNAKTIKSGSIERAIQQCHACRFTKPDKVEQEIVQLHHTEMISDLDKDGKQIVLEEAIKMLIPLCPTCHQIAHTSKPPLSVDLIKRLRNID